MSLADEVRTVRQRVAARLSELEPLVREYQELLELAQELGIATPETGHGTATAAAPSADADPEAAPAPAAEDPIETGRTRRRTGSGTRSKTNRQRRQPAPGADAGPELDARLIETLRAQPGVTITDLASILGVPPTSLYRPVRELTSSGAVVKRGRGLFAES